MKKIGIIIMIMVIALSSINVNATGKTSTKTGEESTITQVNITELYNEAINSMSACAGIRDNNSTIESLVGSTTTSNKVFKEKFNTINNITDVDTFIFDFLFKLPLRSESKMNDENTFMNEIRTYKTFFNWESEVNGDTESYEITNRAYEAIEKVWQFIYDYYQETGVIYDFYENTEIPYVNELRNRLYGEAVSDDETSSVADKETETSIKEAETTDESSAIEETERTEKLTESNNKAPTDQTNIVFIVIIVILAFVIIGLFILLVCFKKSKNKQ